MGSQPTTSYRRPDLLSLLFRALLAAICLVGVWYSALLARAESLFRQSTLSSVSAAVSLVPYNPRYLVGLASLQPEHSSALLNRAVALNEHDPRAWVQLGLDAEFQRQDLASAEQCYRRAAQVSQMFYPRSNLANFYYRYQRREEFFKWVPLVLQMAYSDPVFLFVQVWDLSNDGRFNESLVQDRARMLLFYAGFLLQTNRLDEAESALVHALQKMAVERVNAAEWPALPYSQDAKIRTFLGEAVDRLLFAGRHDSARRISAMLHDSGWAVEPAPSPIAPLTNGSFREPSFQHGFDWVFKPQSGVMLDQYAASSKLRIIFNGKEPEACQLLQQYLILKPNGRYRLSWDAESETIAKNSGLQWRLLPVSERGPAPTSDLVSLDVLGIADAVNAETVGTWDFTAPAEPLNLLTLEYVRRLGTVRLDGDLSLRSVALTSLPQ